MMKLNTGMRRMDSLMAASNIKKMSRLELLYTCVANLARLMKKLEDSTLPEGLLHYTEDDGNLTLKGAHDDMDSNIMQNPADLDAAYRKKAGTEEYL